MASGYSGYALPGGHHGYSKSFSGIHLSPEQSRPTPSHYPYGTTIKKAVSNNALYTHTETSRETSPQPSPAFESGGYHLPALENNAGAFKQNRNTHLHTHTRSWSPMKSRSRGASDLGDAGFRTHAHAAKPTHSVSNSWLSLPEALTSLLVPLPYILASTTYSSMSGWAAEDFPPLAIYEATTTLESAARSRTNGVLETGVLTAGTLLAVGLVAKITSTPRTLDRRKQSTSSSASISLVSRHAVQSMISRILSLALPVYASLQLGGSRVGLLLLITLALGLANGPSSHLPSFGKLQQIWSSKVASSAVILFSFMTDEAGFTIQNSLTGVMLGYLALALSILVVPPPLPAANSRFDDPDGPGMSILTRSVFDNYLTLAAGTLVAIATALAAWLTSSHIGLSPGSLLLETLTILAMTLAITFSSPSTLCSPGKAGLALGCLTTASCSFLFSPSIWPGTVFNGGLCALAFLSVLYDTNNNTAHGQHDHHDHEHTNHAHGHHHNHHHHNSTESVHSALTKLIMARCEPGSLVYSILSEKDSRRIAYFTTLNFGFMIVQGVYGYLSGSLGLLSDTVHMFFDCLGLIVGLGAAVASKWPTSSEKPYGWSKLNTLAGFGNGVFLMLVSVEFVWEAIEGILDKRELRHVQELLVVSTLGLLVNLVGLFAFGHAHAGHDHGHSHSHDHSHVHTNGHAHSHDCDHAHDHHKSHADHGNGHHHDNDNMHGIFLHVAADAGGSLAVIISTALTLWKPWYLWDPLATIIIAVLIFAAVVPLVTSSGQKLLLVIPDDLEYSIKNTLHGLSELRGVVGYAAPRFWLDDREDVAEAHGHQHHGHIHAPLSGQQKVQGIIHIIAAPAADLEDVRERVEEYTRERHMDLVIHVEREGDGQCWCGGAG